MLAYFIPIPYELIKGIFGTFIADNFNAIMLIIAITGIVFRTLKKKKQSNNWLDKAQKTQNNRFEYLNNGIHDDNENIRQKKQEAKNRTFEAWAEKNNKDGYAGNRKLKTKWYPTGWTFNEETQLWEPPDYIKKESDQKWEWDQKERIWIDKEKAARNERYRKAHEGQPPTFEEWKAAREAEQEQDSNQPQ